MSSSPPKLIAIDHDDHHAQFIGILDDGRQFFLTEPFEPAVGGEAGCEYLALFFFDESGQLLDAKVESFGPRNSIDLNLFEATRIRWLEELGEPEYCRIEVAPFRVARFGQEFGLIPREPEDEDDVWAVELLPGNYMAFFEPWDSGDYDT